MVFKKDVSQEIVAGEKDKHGTDGEEVYSFIKSAWAKLCWPFAAFLLLRLFFAQGGILEFFEMETMLEDKRQQMLNLTEENRLLQIEINRLQTDQEYQKKVVRDELGVISIDEYLVVFIDKGVAEKNP